MSQPAHVTDHNFDAVVLSSSLPILVDFWAEWCGPCIKMTPLINALAEQFTGKLVVAMLDGAENARTLQRFAVYTLPTFVLFRKGREVARITGEHSQKEIEDWINRQIKQ